MTAEPAESTAQAKREGSGHERIVFRRVDAAAVRRDGQISALEGLTPLAKADLERLASGIATLAQLGQLKASGDIGFAMADGDRGSDRVSLVMERGSISAVMRRIPLEIPDLDTLGIPPVAKRLAALPRGLILVAGPGGSGKSTTLAAMVDFVNRESSGHVLAIEDPIEHVHRDRCCFITQREIGSDCPSVDQALRHQIANGGSHLRSARPSAPTPARRPNLTAPVEPLPTEAPIAADPAISTSTSTVPAVASPPPGAGLASTSATTAQQRLLERLRRV